MSALDRVAQFLPFAAALTRHDSAVRETVRLTDSRAELDEIRKDELDVHLQFPLLLPSHVLNTNF